jgi:hypothetical protein
MASAKRAASFVNTDMEQGDAVPSYSVIGSTPKAKVQNTGLIMGPSHDRESNETPHNQRDGYDVLHIPYAIPHPPTLTGSLSAEKGPNSSYQQRLFLPFHVSQALAAARAVDPWINLRSHRIIPCNATPHQTWFPSHRLR